MKQFGALLLAVVTLAGCGAGVRPADQAMRSQALAALGQAQPAGDPVEAVKDFLAAYDAEAGKPSGARWRTLHDRAHKAAKKAYDDFRALDDPSEKRYHALVSLGAAIEVAEVLLEREKAKIIRDTNLGNPGGKVDWKRFAGMYREALGDLVAAW